ncbi:unnamed protein product [Merluccius merluccius]
MAASEEEETTVSLVDVLEEDEELENEASAVLAGSDSDLCSYPQGYVKRQALYACNTCTPKGGEAAGVCLACSYKCHEGHDLFELYTKRNFRCDCGNSKFKQQCKLYPDKEQLNSENKYSHNFFGLYCTCNRPYPDPDDQVEDEMVQCILCEDWLHGRHLGCVTPDCVELQEMVCESCMNKNSFLWTYAATVAAPGASSSRLEGEEEQKEEQKEEEVKSEETKKEGEASTSLETGGDEEEKAAVPAERCKRRREDMEEPCRLEELQEGGGPRRVQRGAVFWPATWRTKLCSCVSCQRCYAANGVGFLLDESDTVLAYETKGQRSEEAQRGHDPLMSALDNLNRVQQLEIIHGYNDMKTELKDFLQSFAAEGKVVTPDDIRRFFEQQQSRKRRRADGQMF